MVAPLSHANEDFASGRLDAAAGQLNRHTVDAAGNVVAARGAVIDLEDERTGQKEHMEFPNGLLTFVEDINKTRTPLHEDIVHFVRTASPAESP